MNRLLTIFVLSGSFLVLPGCQGGSDDAGSSPPPPTPTDAADASTPADHAHDEVPLGKTTIGDMEVSGAQGHGAVEPGKLCHLVIKLPYNDGGSTIVRSWIGTEQRELYLVGKGEYAASHDDYDIHAEAPDPLPADARWWVEIEKPDGTKVVGSFPILR
jgi:hypothetical protein